MASEITESEQSLLGMAASHVKKCIITVFNLTQAQGWFCMFMLICIKIANNPHGTLWNAKEELAFEIELY